MRSLGNSRIGTGGNGIKIKDPSAVEGLLDVVIEAHQEKRRVIFFCSCEEPKGCHRLTVAGLLRQAAARREVELTTVEWPGGDTRTAHIEVADSVIRSVLNGASRVPLGQLRGTAMRDLLALPWYSRVKLSAADSEIAIISGPAKLTRGWYLPVCGPPVSRARDSLSSLRLQATRTRKLNGYEPRHS
jgi:hypothetical protein